MRPLQPTFSRPGRRAFLLGTVALAVSSFSTHAASADTDPLAESDPVAFDFDVLSARAKQAAGKPYVAPDPAPGLPENLTYDLYRQIAFNPEHARWRDNGAQFQMHAFHMGWLFPTPVGMFEVTDGTARPFAFEPSDFDYRHDAKGIMDDVETFPGVAGFRLHYRLNRADIFDELLAFQGASYFRALGRGNAYGLSARGLAIATAGESPEEFPTFTEFYLERPGVDDTRITLFAMLDSPSVSGAYRFVITPGQDTTIDVTARLWFREDTPHFGVAPLTSMYLYSDADRVMFDDYRPQVHDSDGLLIQQGSGDTLWRALTNPPHISTSHFAETSPRGFGLHQRDRAFSHYQDPEARYQDRPSVQVETSGDWGAGDVRLVELPTDLEIHDNIVAYWSPEGGALKGEAREYSYRLHWGMLAPNTEKNVAVVVGTRAGKGGVSGVEQTTDTRKFVVDFDGALLRNLPPEAAIVPQVSVGGGEIAGMVLYKVEETGHWRLALDVKPTAPGPIELMAHIEGYDQRLSETWLYQWIVTE